MTCEIDWSTAPEGSEFYAAGRFRRDDAVWNGVLWCFGMSRDNAALEEDYQPRPQQWPEEDRITHIGQNGGDGLHYDPVNNPKHYAIAPGVEAIDIIEASLTPEQFRGYLLGNFLKYRLRAGDKGDLQQDIDKSNWYRERLNESKN